MPGDLGGPVVTTLVCFLILHARLRVHWAPSIPHALLNPGRTIHAKLGRYPRRGIAKLRLQAVAQVEARGQVAMDEPCGSSTSDYKMDMKTRVFPAFASAAERVYLGCRDTEDRVASRSPKETPMSGTLLFSPLQI